MRLRGSYFALESTAFALQFSPRDGARFAAGFARCGCGLRSFVFCQFRARRRDLTPAARVKKGQISESNHQN